MEHERRKKDFQDIEELMRAVNSATEGTISPSENPSQSHIESGRALEKTKEFLLKNFPEEVLERSLKCQARLPEPELSVYLRPVLLFVTNKRLGCYYIDIAKECFFCQPFSSLKFQRLDQSEIVAEVANSSGVITFVLEDKSKAEMSFDINDLFDDLFSEVSGTSMKQPIVQTNVQELVEFLEKSRLDDQQ